MRWIRAARRKVLKVGAIATAWVPAAADRRRLAPLLGLPDWTLRLVCPTKPWALFAMLLAWHFGRRLRASGQVEPDAAVHAQAAASRCWH
jgi:hypothetical protein